MAAKPPAYNHELHFFPGARQLFWFSVQGTLAAEAWGGEEAPAGSRNDIMRPRQTTPGRYVIYSYAPYKTRTWPMSRIVWGTRLKVDPATGELMFESAGRSGGQWRLVRSVSQPS